MKKFILIALVLLLEAPAYSSDMAEILRRYYTDPLIVKRVYECIKAVRFKEIEGFSDFSLQDETFTLLNDAGKRMVTFKSMRFRELYGKLSDRKLFLELMRNAKAYGIDTGIKPFKTRTGSSENFQCFEARVLILTHGEGLDEEFLVFLADK
jgi:hypothetical protein